MKVITLDERKPEDRDLLAHLTIRKPKRQIINPFPFSIAEHLCLSILDLFEYVARHVLLPLIEAVLRKFFGKR